MTIALYVLPDGHYIAYPVVLLSTYAHEMGHGMTALLSGGEPYWFWGIVRGAVSATVLLSGIRSFVSASSHR